ncbi:hypothetical protein RSAG8_03606, partial [Rhizoctonia solani AG-8 WAC10335]
LYVNQPDEKVEDRQRMMVADASTNLMSALMLGASVSFLAIPDLEDIARLAGVTAAACSLGSLAAGIVRRRILGAGRCPRWTILLPGYTLTMRGATTRLGVAGLGASCVARVGLGMASGDPGLNRTDRAGLRSFVRRESGAGYGLGGSRLESDRQGWPQASSQGLVRLWGTW